MEQLILAR